jgi:hypothetical protein
LGAAVSGANSDITSLTGLTTALNLVQGGTGATTAAAGRTNLGAAASGANSDITSLTGLTTALSVAQGGTGASSTSPFFVFAGPSVGPTAGAPTFRSLVSGDIPWATPGTIGSTTPSSAAFTSVTSNAQIGHEFKPFGTTAGNTGEIRFDELAANGTNYIGFKSPDLLATNVIWTLPSADGSSGQVLRTDGARNLTWVAAGGVPSGAAAGDLTGTYPNPTIATVGSVTATNVASGANAANAATNANTASTIVRRDASGNFSAGTITANLTGNVTGTATNVTGTVAIANGGTGATTAAAAFDAVSPLTTIGDILMAGTGGTDSRLAGNSTTSKQFLTSTGTGTAATTPSWGALGATDIPALDASKITTGTLALAQGGTGANLAATGGSGQYLKQTASGGTVSVGTIAATDVPWASPGAIGSGIASTGAFTTLTTTGNVGIGTTAPNSNFQIGSQSSVSTATPVSLSLGGTYSATAGANPKLLIWDTGTSSYGMGVSNSQFDFMIPTNARYSWNINGSEKMRLDPNGNVGLGVISPSAKLELSDTVQRKARILLTGQEYHAAGYTDSQGIAILLGVNRTANRQLWLFDSTTLASPNATNTGLRILLTGTSAQIDAISTDGTTQKNVTYIGSITTASDRRLKTNITPLTDALDKIAKINGVTFNYTHQDPEKKHLGVIAQEVDSVFPEAVMINEQGHLGVNYPALIAPLIEALKEEHSLVTILRQQMSTTTTSLSEAHAKNSSLQLEVDNLRARVEQIERQNKRFVEYICAQTGSDALCAQPR